MGGRGETETKDEEDLCTEEKFPKGVDAVHRTMEMRMRRPI